MKILWIARTCPYPPNDGEKVRVFNLLKNLSHHEITLVFRAMDEEDLQGVPILKKYCHEVKYVKIERPKSNSERLKWCLPFLISKYPISISTILFKEIKNLIQGLCNNNNYDIIQVEHSSLSSYLDKINVNDKSCKILTMHNIDYLRSELVQKNTKLGVAKIYQYLDLLKYKQWELSAIESFDRVIVMSNKDKETLLTEGCQSEVEVVPNGVDADGLKPITPLNNPYTLIFVASMDSAANHDAAVFFLERIFPLIKDKYPAMKAYMVGRRPNSQLLDFCNNVDIFVTGKVPDVTAYYAHASISIVPLRSGGGTRLKILEAMALGVPVVTTSIGCEGLEVEHGKHVLISDKPEEFSAAISSLFEDSSLRQRLILEGRSMVEERYNWRTIAEHQDAIYMNCFV